MRRAFVGPYSIIGWYAVKLLGETYIKGHPDLAPGLLG